MIYEQYESHYKDSLCEEYATSDVESYPDRVCTLEEMIAEKEEAFMFFWKSAAF